MASPSPPPFALSECMCAFGTTHSQELRQIISVVKMVCFESNIHVHRAKQCMNIYYANEAKSLLLMQADCKFFDTLWHIDPNIGSAPANPAHPCLNQRMCRAIQSLLSEKNTSSTALNTNTAECEIAIPLNFNILESVLHNVVDDVFLYIKWSDPHHLYVVARGALTKTHRIRLLVTRRVFLQQRPIDFAAAFIISMQNMRAIINELHNIEYTHVCFACDPDTKQLRVMAWQFACNTCIDIPYMEWLSDLSRPPTCPSQVETVAHLGGPFTIDQIAVFLKSKSTMFQHIVVYFSEALMCLELRVERDGGMVRVLTVITRSSIPVCAPYNRVISGSEALTYVLHQCSNLRTPHTQKPRYDAQAPSSQTPYAVSVGDEKDPVMWTHYDEDENVGSERGEDEEWE